MAYNIVLIGAGDRGTTYTDWILKNSNSLKVTAVADPDLEKQKRIMKKHGLSSENCFGDWRDLIHSDLSCDGVIIATPDKQHTEPALAFLELGVHVLLEKPMALNRDEVLRIRAAAELAEEKGGSLTVCHVLRYSPFFTKLKEIIRSGRIGDIQTMYHGENVAYYHMAHSYVRGNWGNSKKSSPIILAKSSHDLDIIHWLMDSRPVQISSVSGRTVFLPENAPQSASDRCLEGCPSAEDCLYEAKKNYLYGIPIKTALSRSRGGIAFAARFMLRFRKLSAILPFLSPYHIWKEWPTSTITENLNENGIIEALNKGPYGRCVYKCDNDQPEHQETIIRFKSGATACFRLHGLSFEEGRTLRIDGKKGSIRAKFGSGSEISLSIHGSSKVVKIPMDSDFMGHSEADTSLMECWSSVFSGGRVKSSVEESLISHLMAFAADESDKSGETVIFPESSADP